MSQELLQKATMATKLSDRSILPSYLGIRDMSQVQDSGADSDFMIRIGEVQRAIWPGDPEAKFQQTAIEYDVICTYRDNQGSSTSKLYERCVQLNPFGGLADKIEFTLRAEDSANRQQNEKNGIYLGKGSKVAILCASGNNSSPLIIGGIRDEQDLTLVNKTVADLGHYFHFVFNGMDFYINNDGDLTVARRGPTEIDGTPKGSQGTLIRLAKDGILLLTPSGSTFSISEVDGKQGIKALSGGSWVTIDKNGVSQGDAEGGSSSLGANNFQVVADSASIAADCVDIGPSPDTYMVRGMDLVQWLTQFVTTLTAGTLCTPGVTGVMNPAVTSQLTAMIPKLQTILSQSCRLK